jgi:hypothetical protein
VVPGSAETKCRTFGEPSFAGSLRTLNKDSDVPSDNRVLARTDVYTFQSNLALNDPPNDRLITANYIQGRTRQAFLCSKHGLHMPTGTRAPLLNLIEPLRGVVV